MKFFKRCIALLFILFFIAFFYFPHITHAALTLPTTPCDQAQIDISYSGISQHLTNHSVREDGTIAFKYGPDNNHFVTHVGDVFNFNITTLFAPSNPFAAIKLMALDSACNLVFGLGPVFSNINPLAENILSYNTNTHTSTLNGSEQISNIYGSFPRYLWVEVWDGINGSNVATYSYLVDVNDPQNPTGAVGEQPPVSDKTPVLIIPGIMGTEMKKGEELLWADVGRMAGILSSDSFMDPLAFKDNGEPLDEDVQIATIITKKYYNGLEAFNYSDRLLNDLFNNYKIGETLFTLPYDWRKDISETATTDLKNKIDSIVGNPPVRKLDIIAHSQGGLVLKRLLYEMPEYQSRINKIIFVGVPNLGAPKAAKALLYGDSMGVEFGFLGLDPKEVMRISQNMPSVYELLPSREFVAKTGSYIVAQPRIKPGVSPDAPYQKLDYDQTILSLATEGLNTNLLVLNDTFHTADYDNLNFTGSSIKTYNIVGCGVGTYRDFIISNHHDPVIITTNGDSTVPLKSAENIPGATTFYALNGKHGTLLSQEGIRQQIVGLLTDTAVDTGGVITTDRSECHYNATIVSVKSPVDLHIYDENQNHLGPGVDGNLEFGIENAQYDIVGHSKFAILPPGHTYTVKFTATDNGTFDFYSQTVNDGQTTNTLYYNQIPVSLNAEGEVVITQDSSQTIHLDENADGVMDAEYLPSAILDVNQSQDLVFPTTTATITGTAGSPEYYRSSVSIAFTAEDPVIAGYESQTSGILKTLYRLDGGVWEELPPPPPSPSPQGGGNGVLAGGEEIVVSAQGPHSLEYYSIDKAGNKEEPKILIFTIDSVAPEIISEFSTSTKDFIFTATDNLDPSPQLTCTSTSCTATDSAGNQTVLTFKKDKILTLRTLRLKTLSYNNQSQTLPDNALVVNYLESRGSLLNFSQTFLLKNQEIASINYVKTKGQSTITRLTKSGVTRETVGGMKILQIKTVTGSLGSGVK
jgi:hypothetical protein